MASKRMNYEVVANDIEQQQIETTPAELHGMISAWLCIASESGGDWFSALLPGYKTTTVIESVYTATEAQFNAEDFDFQLLLPDDEKPLAVRAHALVGWCQGFINGLGHVQTDCLKKPELEEAINEISKISELDYEELQDNNDNENSFSELEEFIRIAVLFIFTEARGSQGRDSISHQDQTIH